MTTFRFKNAARFSVFCVVGCSRPIPTAANCPKLDLGYELQQYRVPEPQALPHCLTEQAVKLSPAGGASNEIASAAVTACGSYLGLYESFAAIERFRQGDLNAQEDAQPQVQKAAERYALSRVVQVRAGECSKRR